MSIYTEVLRVGGHGGSPFYARGRQLSFVKTLRIWKGTYDKHRMIKAIEIAFTDGSPPQKFGVSKGDVDFEFTFNNGEKVTKLSLWGNGNGKRFGKIHFETSQGRSFDTGHCDGKDEFPIDIGSGLMVEIEGNCGSDIDNCGFKFIKSLSNMELINVQYPTLAFDTIGISPIALDEYKDTNDSTVSKDWHFENTLEKTTEHTWSNNFGVELWGEYSVKATVPEVSEANKKWGWKLSYVHNDERKSIKKKTLKWNNSGTLKPGESIHLIALTRQGSLPSLPYEGDLVVTTINGRSESFQITGTYKGIDYTGVDIQTKDNCQKLGLL